MLWAPHPANNTSRDPGNKFFLNGALCFDRSWGLAWLGVPARRCLRGRAAPRRAQSLEDVELCCSPWFGSGWQAGIATPLPSQPRMSLLCLQLYRGGRGDFVQVVLPSEEAVAFMLGELGSFGRRQKRGDARWLVASNSGGLDVRMKIPGSMQPLWWVQHGAAPPYRSTVLGHSFPSRSVLRIEDV